MGFRANKHRGKIRWPTIWQFEEIYQQTICCLVLLSRAQLLIISDAENRNALVTLAPNRTEPNTILSLSFSLSLNLNEYSLDASISSIKLQIFISRFLHIILYMFYFLRNVCVNQAKLLLFAKSGQPNTNTIAYRWLREYSNTNHRINVASSFLSSANIFDWGKKWKLRKINKNIKQTISTEKKVPKVNAGIRSLAIYLVHLEWQTQLKLYHRKWSIVRCLCLQY